MDLSGRSINNFEFGVDHAASSGTRHEAVARIVSGGTPEGFLTQLVD
jgi:hypothetical protein